MGGSSRLKAVKESGWRRRSVSTGHAWMEFWKLEARAYHSERTVYIDLTHSL